MLVWLVEMNQRQVPLEHVTIPEIRSVIDPVRDELAAALTTVADDDDSELSIVFVVGGDGRLAITLKGDSFTINQARDILGNTRRISPQVS